MRVACGHLDSSGTPRILFELSGIDSEGKRTGAQLQAVIDTGFTGFVSLPLEQAFPLNLPLAGYSFVNVADGRASRELTARGCARIADRSEEVAVILHPGSDEILIGVALLRALGLALLMTRDEVLLLDQEAIDDFHGIDPARSCVRDSSSLNYGELLRS